MLKRNNYAAEFHIHLELCKWAYMCPYLEKGSFMSTTTTKISFCPNQHLFYSCLCSQNLDNLFFVLTTTTLSSETDTYCFLKQVRLLLLLVCLTNILVLMNRSLKPIDSQSHRETIGPTNMLQDLVGPHTPLLALVKRRKLAWCRHVTWQSL